MIKVLDVYRSLLRRISEFENCSEFASLLIVLILQDLPVGEEVAIREWEKPYLCHYTLDRLFSFSIFTARVLSVGDPVHHTNGTTQKCM
uniref:Uncharacterized protein n=1 Tax=Oreochromis niloticus TaxID=8128 RepID=A0A669EH16_ORENI